MDHCKLFDLLPESSNQFFSCVTAQKDTATGELQTLLWSSQKLFESKMKCGLTHSWNSEKGHVSNGERCPLPVSDQLFPADTKLRVKC